MKAPSLIELVALIVLWLLAVVFAFMAGYCRGKASGLRWASDRLKEREKR
jgi:hypothetical protein